MQNIALQVTLNGIPQAVSSLAELELKLNEAKVQLLQMGEGSSAFKKLDGEIKSASATLTKFKTEAKNRDLETSLNTVGKLGNAIAGSFTTASAAFQIFGVESEQASRAMATAQNLLTIALGARSVAEGLVAVKTLASTIATRAQTLATATANTTTKAFYTTLAANPYGAILAVIGLVVGALISLTSATDDSNDAEARYQETLAKTKREREFQLSLLQAQGVAEIEISKRRRDDALEDLRAARTRLDVLKRTNASDIEINKELKIILESKKTVILENARIEKITSEERLKNDKEVAEQFKKNSEERTRLLLDELRIQGELRKLELQRTTEGLDINLPEFNLNLEKQNELLKSLQKNQNDYNDVFEEYSQLTTDFNIMGLIDTQKMLFEIPKSVQTAIRVNEDLLNSSLELAGYAADYESNRVKTLLRAQKEFIEGTEESTEEYIDIQKDLLIFERNFIRNFVETQIQGFEGTAEVVAEQRKILTEQAKIVFDNLIENANRLVDAEIVYEKSADRIKKLSEENIKLAKSTEVLNGFLEKNGEIISKSINLPITFANAQADALILEKEIATKRFDQAQIFASDIEQLEYTLLQNGIDIRNASYEEKIKLLLRYLKLEIEATENAEKEKQDAAQKTIDNILNTIGQLQAALGAIQATTSDFFNFQFDQLEKRYNRIQDSLVEDTAENNAKRIEAEKIYNAEKSRLEKQAAKASLRIQLAQTIANAAQAITVALTAGPIVGQILAGVVAAASLAQIGIVTAQLNAVDSYRRGGVLKSYATGGYVRGPSHENGGVKFQGGGIELEGRESVINRVSTVRYQDLLNQINLAGGGSPIMANLDDSRIVEAIATQRREPIRAYVVQSEITSSQNIQKRLELLSQI